MKNLFFVASCFFLFETGSAYAQSNNSPELFLKNLYADLANDSLPPKTAAAEEQAAYAPSLRTLIDRDTQLAQGVGLLDYMPICICQDTGGMVVQNLAVQPVDDGNFKADVTLLFSNSPNQAKQNFQLYLTKDKTKWQIYDVATKDTPSLRTALQQSIAERVDHKPDAFGSR